MLTGPNFVTFGRAASAAADLFKLIDRESQIDSFDPSGIQPTVLVGDIELESVSFSYPTRPDTVVLRNFSLRIPARKVTALVVRLPKIMSVRSRKVINGVLGTERLRQEYHHRPPRAMV